MHKAGHLPAPRANRRTATLVFLTILVALFVLLCSRFDLSIAYAIQPATPTSPANDGRLAVHFIDVGQGDSTLVIAPDGASALIDGGLRNDMALEYLRQIGVQSLDVVVATHPDQDHIAGLIDILPAFEVGGVWQPGSSNTTLTFGRFLTTIAEQGIPFHDVGTGDTIPLGDLTFDVLHGVPQASELNNTSLVLRLEFGHISFLFTGDAEEPVEEFLVGAMGDELATTVLKMGHHGSRSSSIPEFVNAVSPTIAVYSAGQGNAHGHPHSEPLANLAAVGATVFGTDRHGTIIIRTDGETLEVALSHNVPSVAGELGATEVELATAEPTLAVTLAFDPEGPDRDCGEFTTQAEAQAFFLAAGGPASDRHRLDANNDGVACESLP